MIYDDGGKAHRRAKRNMDRILDNDSYASKKGSVEDRKKAKRLAKLAKKQQREAS